MTNPVSVIERVAKTTKCADAGVAISLECRVDPRYVIWAMAASDGRINMHSLDVSSTDEARLKAHVEGFIENHVKAFAAQP